MAQNNKTPLILLVEDNPGDIELISESLAITDVAPNVVCVRDGIEAMNYLNKLPPYEDAVVPTIVIMDLNLPRKDGREVLSEIKGDPDLASVPVIVLSGSDAPQDISVCYHLHANCYLVKPRNLYGFGSMIQSLVDFWFKQVRLPFIPEPSDRE